MRDAQKSKRGSDAASERGKSSEEEGVDVRWTRHSYMLRKTSLQQLRSAGVTINRTLCHLTIEHLRIISSPLPPIASLPRYHGSTWASLRNRRSTNTSTSTSTKAQNPSVQRRRAADALRHSTVTNPKYRNAPADATAIIWRGTALDRAQACETRQRRVQQSRLCGTVGSASSHSL
jgi:hypothetical protein